MDEVGNGEVEVTVVCGDCGVGRPPELAGPGDRPSCPACGSNFLRIAIKVHETIAAAVDKVEFSIRPAVQNRSWQQRWAQVQADLPALLAPHAEPLDAATIHTALARLGEFYAETYHLKDALKEAAGVDGVPNNQEIENAISNDPDLALLADLANLSKHGGPGPGHKPRSGEWPISQGVAGTTSGASDGWRLDVTFEHGGQEIDGLEAAERAVRAWSRWLTSVGLI